MTPVKLEGIITGDFGGELKRWSQSVNQVQRMQNKRILGTVGRTLLVAKRL
jgi:hypothetical protein